MMPGAAVATVIEDTLRLANIPAPSFGEAERGAAVAVALEAAGLCVSHDEAGNEIGLRAGLDPTAPGVAVLAHLDTVFPAGTMLEVRREGERLVGPGVGDNALALGALLWLARLSSGWRQRRDLLLVATVGEEGLGDLRGARAFAAAHANLHAAVVLEGHFLGQVVTGGPGSRRLAVTTHGPGGHSWQDFGAPSAIHALVAAATALLALPLPATPRTTLNIGTIEGGRSVNTIADQATMQIDLRSLDEEALERLETAARSAILTAAASAGASTEIALVGRRPAANLPAGHPLVEQACATLRSQGIEPALELASTDGNALLAAGIAAVTIGISNGAYMHRLDEWIAVEPIAAGLQQLARLVGLLADAL